MSKFDIDKFPTSEAAKRMLKRISPVYQTSYVMKWLCQVMGMEWDEARKYVLSLREQVFTETVTWGIEYQEHKYSIEPDESLSLEERRARLGRKTSKRFPLNPGNLERYIEKGWGETVDVDETVAPGCIKLTFPNGATEAFDNIFSDVRKIKPSHLSLMAELQWKNGLYIPYGMALTVSQTERVDLAPRPNSIRAPTEVGFASVEDGTAFIDPSRLSSADMGISAVILVQGAFPKEVRSALQPEFVVPEDEIISSLLAGIGQSLGGIAEIRPCEPKEGALEQSCFGMAIETRIEAVEPSRVDAGANSLRVGMVCFGTAIASIGCDPSGLDDMEQDIYPTSMLPFGPPFMLG